MASRKNTEAERKARLERVKRKVGPDRGLSLIDTRKPSEAARKFGHSLTDLAKRALARKHGAAA